MVTDWKLHKEFSNTQPMFFLSATGLPQDQFWAVLERKTSLTSFQQHHLICNPMILWNVSLRKLHYVRSSDWFRENQKLFFEKLSKFQTVFHDDLEKQNTLQNFGEYVIIYNLA